MYAICLIFVEVTVIPDMMYCKNTQKKQKSAFLQKDVSFIVLIMPETPASEKWRVPFAAPIILK
jgi:hypothetical protein